MEELVWRRCVSGYETNAKLNESRIMTASMLNWLSSAGAQSVSNT